MKNFTKIFNLSILLTMSCLVFSTMQVSAVTIHFIDKGEEVLTKNAPDNQGNVTLTTYFATADETALKTAGHLQSFNGFEFVGWRSVAPVNHEREHGVLNPTTDETSAGNTEHIAVSLNIGTEDITLFAVYRRKVDCFRQVRKANAIAGQNYLIVGRYGGYGGDYYVMGNENTSQGYNKGANATAVETHVITRDNTYAFGSDDGGETTNTIRKIYTHTKNSTAPYYDQYVWKLVDDGDNYRWNNQGDVSKWLRFYANYSYYNYLIISYYRFENYDDIIANGESNASNFDISATNEVFDIGRGRTVGKTKIFGFDADNTIIKLRLWFSNTYKNFFMGDENNSNANSFSKEDNTAILLFREAQEYHFICHNTPYTVYFRAHGNATASEQVAGFTASKTSDHQTISHDGGSSYDVNKPWTLALFNGVTMPTVTITCAEGWTLLGWVEDTPVAQTTTDPSARYIANGSCWNSTENRYNPIYNNKILYAVYGHNNGSGGYDYYTSYPTCEPYTVYFDEVGGNSIDFTNVTGTVDASAKTITPTAYGGNITMPKAVFNEICMSEWVFQGWAETECAGTATLPTLKVAGSTYKPIADDEHFYAVYGHKVSGDTYNFYTSYPTCTQYTVTLDPGTGTFVSTTGWTQDGTNYKKEEVSIVSGVELLSVQHSCSVWNHFAGWSATKLTEETSEQPTDLIAAGDLFHPQTDVTLYAVYVRGGSLYHSTPDTECTGSIVTLHACADDDCGDTYMELDSDGETKKYTVDIQEASAGTGVTLVEPAHIGCSRWTFVGWSRTPYENNYTNSSASLTALGNYTPTQKAESFYAVYKHVSRDYWTSSPECGNYTINLHACDGTIVPGGETDITMTDEGGNGIELPNCAPACTDRGWKFCGWIEGGELSATTSTSLQMFSAGSTYYPLNNNVELYAVYSIDRYNMVTNSSQLEAGKEYAIVFYFNFGNDATKKFNWFEMSGTQYQYGSDIDNLRLNGIEVYTDEHGQQYMDKPDNGYIWKLGKSGDNWTFQNVGNNNYLDATSPDRNRELHTYNSVSNDGKWNIDIDNHTITLARNVYYTKLHFTRNTAVEPNVYYADIYTSPDDCYLFKNAGTYYASWAHCSPYTVLFDGCDGNPDFSTITDPQQAQYDDIDEENLSITEQEAGHGIILPSAEDMCDGWQLAGWAENHIDTAKTTLNLPHDTLLTIYPAGSLYKPGRNKITLYAVYYKPQKDGNNYIYKKVTSAANLHSGVNSLIVYNNNNAMNNIETNNANNNGGWPNNYTDYDFDHEETGTYGGRTLYKQYFRDNYTKNYTSTLGATNVSITGGNTIKLNNDELNNDALNWQFISKDGNYVVRNYYNSFLAMISNGGRVLDHNTDNWVKIYGPEWSERNPRGYIEQYSKSYYYRVYSNSAMLSSNPVCEISLVESSGNFKFRTNYLRQTSYLSYGSNSFRSDNTGNTTFSIYQQQADFCSYPCSKLVEAARWERDAAIVESISISGAPVKSSKTIDGIEPTHSTSTDGVADDGTYRIRHHATPGSRIRFKWGNDYFNLAIPYVSTENHHPNVENFPNHFLVVAEGEHVINKLTHLKKVCVYSGATLTILPNTTLNIDTLVLRCAGDKSAPIVKLGEGSQLNISSKIIYHDIRIDGTRYYMVHFPFGTDLKDMRYSGLIVTGEGTDTVPTPKYRVDYWLKYYDGAGRARDAENGTISNYTSYWTHVPGTRGETGSYKAPAGKGFILGIRDPKTEEGNHYRRTLRFPMTVEDDWIEKERVQEDKWKEIAIEPSKVTDTSLKNHSGWNLIGNPYLHTYYPGTPGNTDESGLLTGHMEMGADGKWTIVDDETKDVPYLTFYNPSDDSYYQTRADQAAMMPFLPVFIQVEDNNVLMFKETPNSMTTKRSMPRYMLAQTYKKPVKAGIVLTDPQMTMGDVTGIVIADKYSADYEIGGDLMKMKNSGKLNLYSICNGTELAFNAMNGQQAEQNIPLGVVVPEAGKYVFAFDNWQYDQTQVKQLLLTDFELGKTVDLLMRDYEFTIRKGTNNTRFAVAVVLNEDENTATPTSVSDTDREDAYCYTTTEGLTVTNIQKATDIRIFDLLGKQIHSAEGVTGKQHFPLPQGVYNIVLTTGNEQTTLRGIVR